MWRYVYILKNQKGEQYVGRTSDLNARLQEHNHGSVIATKIRDHGVSFVPFAFRDEQR